MKLIKIVALIMLIVSIPVIVFSCADGTEDTAPTVPIVENGSADKVDGQTAEEEYDDGTIRAATYIEPRPDYPELPVRDLGGYTFRIISRSEASNAHWWNLDISAEELTGDPINDAVFTRNSAIEEKYNISIVNFPQADILNRVRTSVRAGSDDFDLVVFNLSYQYTLAQEGMIHDLKRVPYIDLTRRWWDQRAVEQLTIGGRLFSTTSDLTIRDKDAAIIMMFSHTLAQNHGLPNLYDMVQNGTWTFEAMFDMMRQATVDLTGDGTIGHEDQVGLLTQNVHALMLFNAAGETLARLDSDGLPELTMHNDRAVVVADFIREMQSGRYAFNAEDASPFFGDIWDEFQVPMFAADRALFYHAGMNRVSLLRSMETDFGILPPPKFDENQENFHITVDAWCASSISIPISVPDIDITGLILEALTFESRYTLIPAYYHINLITRFARDEESHEMINIILDNRVYDLGEVFRWGNIRSFFYGDVARGRPTSLTTFYDRSANMINRQIERTIDRLDEVG